jgi:uncharacterized membrane protein YbhN (UPF0104 family)
LMGRSELMAVEWVAVALLAGVVVTFALALSQTTRGLLTRLLSVRLLRRLSGAWNLLSDALQSYRRRPRALLQAYAVALFGIGCTTLVNWFISLSMGGHMGLGQILLINPLITLVIMAPISVGSGIGVSQNAYPYLYGLVGVPQEHALAVSIVVQGVVILGSLPGVLPWLRDRHNVMPRPAVSPE